MRVQTANNDIEDLTLLHLKDGNANTCITVPFESTYQRYLKVRYECQFGNRTQQITLSGNGLNCMDTHTYVYSTEKAVGFSGPFQICQHNGECNFMCSVTSKTLAIYVFLRNVSSYTELCGILVKHY